MSNSVYSASRRNLIRSLIEESSLGEVLKALQDVCCDKEIEAPEELVWQWHEASLGIEIIRLHLERSRI